MPDSDLYNIGLDGDKTYDEEFQLDRFYNKSINLITPNKRVNEDILCFKERKIRFIPRYGNRLTPYFCGSMIKSVFKMYLKFGASPDYFFIFI